MNIPAELIEQFAHGNVIIFVGSKLSQVAKLPDWADLICKLANELEGCPPNADYRDIAQYYEIMHGRNRLIRTLRQQFLIANVKPTPLHRRLVKLPVPAILTTNYDDLLEQSLREAKLSYALVVGNIDVNFWSVDELQLVKLHGDLYQPDSIVITTEDYERFATQRLPLARLLANIFQRNTVLFLGYDIVPPDIQLILTQVCDESGKFARNLYTVQFDALPLVVKGLERRGFKVINLDIQPYAATWDGVLLEWLHALSKRIEDDTSEVEIRINGNFSELKPKIDAIVDSIVGKLKISRDRIKVRGIRQGSLLIYLEMPTLAAHRLIALYKAGDPDLRKWRIQKIRVLNHLSPTTTKSVLSINQKIIPQALAIVRALAKRKANFSLVLLSFVLIIITSSVGLFLIASSIRPRSVNTISFVTPTPIPTRTSLMLKDIMDTVQQIAWSPNGALLATRGSSDYKTAQIWRSTNTERLVAVLEGHTDSIVDLAWSPDGTRIVTSSTDDTARIWNADTGEQIVILNGHTGSVMDVAWSPDGTRLATGSYDRTARIWKADTGEQTTLLEGHTAAVRSVTWSPDGTQLATGSADGTAWTWRVDTGARLVLLTDKADFIIQVAWSPDGTRVATGSTDRNARVRDIRTNQHFLMDGEGSGAVSQLAWSPNGELLAFDSKDVVEVWEVKPQGWKLYEYTDNGTSVSQITWSPDGTKLAIVNAIGNVRIWSATSRQEKDLTSYKNVGSMIWLSNSQNLALLLEDGTLQTVEVLNW